MESLKFSKVVWILGVCLVAFLGKYRSKYPGCLQCSGSSECAQRS